METSNYNVFTALIIAAVVIHYSKSAEGDDIGTNFFLKASKSVPRIGRRSMDYENYFLKASKSVPRIGRKRTSSGGTVGDLSSLAAYYRNENSVPGLEKRSALDKYFTEVGQPIWSRIEKGYEEYPGMIQSDEPYRESNAENDPEFYWQRMKKALEEEEPKFQAEVK